MSEAASMPPACADSAQCTVFGAGGPSYELVAALKAQPGFAAAARAFVHGTLDLYQGNRLLNTVVNDRGRLIIGHIALYLHYGFRADDPRSGLIVGRLKTICTEQRICSAGRAEAIVGLLRLFGNLEPAPLAQDRRVRRLVPTDRMVASHRLRWDVAFAAVGQVLPDARAASNAMARDEFVAALVRQFVQHYLGGLRLLHHAHELHLFADRNAGFMVLFSLLQAAGSTPGQPLMISISPLAQRFGVSRVHVRKLLHDVAAAGLIARPHGSEGPIVLDPRLTAAAENFIATAFLFIAHCARAALDDFE